MVFFNYATMQMAAKIVYYGPGLCGKTTNLHHIYTKTSPQSRGEMVSLETETDRTLFFDLLPIDVGVIGGFKTRLQLYTVPGQVFYNTTRKLVLKGVDGIVFVADSQKAMLEANVESLKNLRENLAEIGTDLDEIPLVIQLNKRDLPNISDVETMVNALDPEGRAEHVEAIAASGVGVFETLKTISKQTLRTLRRRMSGEEPSRPAATRSGAHFRVQDNSRTMAGPKPAPASASTSTASTSASATSASAAAPAFTAASIAAETVEELDAMVAPPAPAAEFDPNETVMARSFDRRVIADAPVADLSGAASAGAASGAEASVSGLPAEAPALSAVDGTGTTLDDVLLATALPGSAMGTAAGRESGPEGSPAEAAGAPRDVAPQHVVSQDVAARDIAAEDGTPLLDAAQEIVPEPEVREAPRALTLDDVVGQASTQYIPPPSVAPAPAPVFAPEELIIEPDPEPAPAPEVKTVKVRSSVDVMAELEALRKRATNTSPKAQKRDIMADLASLRPKRDLARTLHLQLPNDVLPRTKSVRVTLSFEDGDQGVIETRDQHVELGDTTDVQSLSVNLKIDLA